MIILFLLNDLVICILLAILRNLKVLDSFGRKPSGLKKGNYVWSGEYGQCVSVREDKFNGKYCYIDKQDNSPFLLFVIINY